MRTTLPHQNLPRAITTAEPSPTQPSSTNLEWLTKTTIQAETATASSKPSATNPAPIVGGVVGGIAALLLAVVGGWLLARRRTRMTVDESDIERWNENGMGKRRDEGGSGSGSGSEGVPRRGVHQHEHHQSNHKPDRPSHKIKTDPRERYETGPEKWDSQRQEPSTRSPLSPRTPHPNSPYRLHPLRQMSSHQSRRSEMSLDLPMQHPGSR